MPRPLPPGAEPLGDFEFDRRAGKWAVRLKGADAMTRERDRYWRDRLQYLTGALVEAGVLDPAQAEALEASVVALNSRLSEDLKDVHAARFFDLMAEAGRRLEAIEDPDAREAARAAGRRLCVAFFGGVA